jgi:glycerol-3-phosphate dehydrogenase
MYKRFEATYYNAGLRMYDWLAGKNLVHRSRFVSPKEALELCPFLKRSGLKGGVIYYDGQFDDSRMNLSVLLAAKERGATLGNYIRVNGFRP